MKITAALLIFVAALSAFAADPAGKWNLTAVAPGGREYKVDLTLKNDEGRWAGLLVYRDREIVLQDVRLDGDEMTCKVPAGDASYGLKLKLAGVNGSGTFTAPDGTTGPISGTRAAESASNDLTGAWQVHALSKDGKEYHLTLNLAGMPEKLHGTLSDGDGTTELVNVNLENGTLTFGVSVEAGDYSIKLAVAGSEMKGTFIGPGGVTGTVSASR